MEIYGTITQKVTINPQDVVEKLKAQKLCGDHDWVFEKEGNYYHGFEVDLGSHSSNSKIQITKEEYDYIKALDLVINYLIEKDSIISR